MDLRNGLRFTNQAPQPYPGPGEVALNGWTRAAILSDLLRETPKNIAMSMPFVRAWRSRFPRAAKDFAVITEDDLMRHAFSALDLVLESIPGDGFEGRTVVEIGPGDNVVLGIPLLALGASAYHAIDRFLGDISSTNALRLYEKVVEALPERYEMRREALPDPRRYPGAQEGKTVFLHPRGIEDYRTLDLGGRADLVFSYGVGGQVASAQSFSRASYELLKAGGLAIHRIYFGPVGCWRRYRNPLTFLAVSDSSWRLANSHRGLSNRVRFHEFARMFEECGFRVATRVTEVFSEEEVEQIRPWVSAPFRNAPTDSLRVAEADFLCLKEDKSSGRE